MAETLSEPSWLAARRERAASLDAPLPRFKGTIGWEFTELKNFDLAAYPTATAGVYADAGLTCQTRRTSSGR